MRADVVAIRAEGLSRNFGSVQALKQLNIAVPRGEIVGLLGHNGAGKTTTIRILNGLLVPSDGRVEVLGMDPATDGHRLRAVTGVLTETPSLDERLTARENLSFSAGLFGVAPRVVAARVAELLDRFDLAARGNDRVAGFSRGMKQRLALARAVVHDPELLFLDEPTAALDPVAARDVHRLIRAYAGDARRTVVITTHNLVEAQRLCDRVVILRQGRAIAGGSPADLSRQMGGAAGRVEIEIQLGDAERAAALARPLLDGATAQADGDVLTIEGLAREGVPALVKRLAAGGVRLYRVSPSEPTLEDAYFALHEDETS